EQHEKHAQRLGLIEMAKLIPCLICGGGPHQEPRPAGDVVLFDCKNCGDYRITSKAIAAIREGNQRRRPLLAHRVRRRFRAGERVLVDSTLVEEALAADAKYPSASEQVENLLIWLAENVPQPGQPI